MFGEERAAQTIRNPEYHAPIPDLLGYLQRETELTRPTLAEILEKSNRLCEVTRNPQQFLEHAVAAVQKSLHDLMVQGIEYRRECEDSLRRLRVESIDLFQIHWPVENAAEVAEVCQAMKQLQDQGKVRWIGVSNFNAEQMRQARGIAPITSLQPPYSLVRREIEEEVLPFCRWEEIGVIAYSPMGSGLLTGAMTRERAASLPAGDWRSRNPEFRRKLRLLLFFSTGSSPARLSQATQVEWRVAIRR